MSRSSEQNQLKRKLIVDIVRWNERASVTSLRLSRLKASVESSSWKYVERAEAIATGLPFTVAVLVTGPWTVRSSLSLCRAAAARSAAEGPGVRSTRSCTVIGTQRPL